MERSTSIGELATALAKAQAVMAPAIKDAAVAGIAPEDDDGNAAAKPAKQAQKPRTVDNDGVIRLPGDESKWDHHGGKALTDVPMETLARARQWYADKDATKNAKLIEAMDDVLESRRPQEAA